MPTPAKTSPMRWVRVTSAKGWSAQGLHRQQGELVYLSREAARSKVLQGRAVYDQPPVPVTSPEPQPQPATLKKTIPQKGESPGPSPSPATGGQASADVSQEQGDQAAKPQPRPAEVDTERDETGEANEAKTSTTEDKTPDTPPASVPKTWEEVEALGYQDARAWLAQMTEMPVPRSWDAMRVLYQDVVRALQGS